MSVHKVMVGKVAKWEVRYRDDGGKQRAERFERRKGKGGADERDDEVKAARRRGDPIDPDRASMTVEAFFEQVFLQTRHASAATRRSWNARWAPKLRQAEVWHLREKWGRWKIKDVNRLENVLRWHAEMRQAGATDATIRSAHNLLVSIVGHAADLDYIGRSRIEGITIAYTPERHDDVWMPAQIETIREYLLARAVGPTHGGANGRADRGEWRWRRRRDAELVSFMGYEGTRPGEAAAIRWTSLLNVERTRIGTVVQVRDTVRVQDPDAPDTRARTKNRGHREVDLETAVQADLRDWWMFCGRPTEGLVFPPCQAAIGDPEAAWTTAALSNWREFVWYVALAAVGLPRRPPKHLRHSCVSMWIREGRDLRSVAEAAGHTMTVCEQTYAHAFRSVDPRERFSMPEAIAAARADAPVRGLRAV